MGPNVVFDVNTLHNTLEVRTQETLDVTCFQTWVLFESFASVTEPITLRYVLCKITSMASLVNSSVAHSAYDNQITLFMFILKATIALYIFINIVLGDFNFIIRIKLQSSLMFLFPQLLRSKVLKLVLLNNTLTLHHDISVNFKVSVTSLNRRTCLTTRGELREHHGSSFVALGPLKFHQTQFI